MTAREAYTEAFRTIRSLDKLPGYEYVDAYMQWVERTPPRWNITRQKAVESCDDRRRVCPEAETFVPGAFRYAWLRRGLERLSIRERNVRWWMDMEQRAKTGRNPAPVRE